MNHGKRWAILPPKKTFCEGVLGFKGITIALDRDDFSGTWDERYWKNVPGPFYSTIFNTMSLMASSHAPGHLIHDDKCEFFWKPPCTEEEYADCIVAMWCDDIDSYGVDGNEHWSPQLVAEWWNRRGELLDWANERYRCTSEDARTFWSQSEGMTDRQLLAQHIDFIENEAEEYLRSYIFLLLEGRAAQSGDSLPMIEG